MNLARCWTLLKNFFTKSSKYRFLSILHHWFSVPNFFECLIPYPPLCLMFLIKILRDYDNMQY